MADSDEFQRAATMPNLSESANSKRFFISKSNLSKNGSGQSLLSESGNQHTGMFRSDMSSNSLGFVMKSPDRGIERFVRMLVFSKTFTVFTAFLAVLSFALFILAVVLKPPEWLYGLDFIVTGFYALEIICRIIVLKDFWTNLFSYLDLLILGGCVADIVVFFSLNEDGYLLLPGMLAFRFIIRFFRTIRLLAHQREYVNMRTVADVDVEHFNPDGVNTSDFTLRIEEEDNTT